MAFQVPYKYPGLGVCLRGGSVCFFHFSSELLRGSVPFGCSPFALTKGSPYSPIGVLGHQYDGVRRRGQ